MSNDLQRELASCLDVVRRGSPTPGADGLTPLRFAEDLERRTSELAAAITRGTWSPDRLRRVPIRKVTGGLRWLSIPTVRDRVVIEWLRRGVGPAIDAALGPATMAYRPGRSAREAVERVSERIAAGRSCACLADIANFFDSIQIDRLLRAISRLVAPTDRTTVLDRMLRAHSIGSAVGLTQGSALSPALSNLALKDVDTQLVAEGFELVRYSDNLCITTSSTTEAETALRRIRTLLAAEGLRLNPTKSQVAEATSGFLWLGYWVGAGGIQISEGAIANLVDRVDKAARGRTGIALEEALKPIVVGWAQYFDSALPTSAQLGSHAALIRTLHAANTVPRTGLTGAQTAKADVIGEAARWDEDEKRDASNEFEPDEREALLDEVDGLATRGLFNEAEKAFDAMESTPLSAPVKNDEQPLDEDAADMFLGLFAAAQSTFEQAVTGTPGRRDFVTMDRPIELQDLADHLAGRRAIAVRPRLPDGTCTLGVIDIDAVDGPVVSALAYAKALQTVASAWGWVTLLEETGGRGAHVWFPVRGRLGSALMSDYLARLVAAAGVPAGFVRVEVLPGPDDAPELHASLMTLPLGVHVESGARSRLEWNDGVPVGLDLSGIGHGEAIPPERLSEAPLEAPLTSSVSSVKPKGPPPMLAQGGETGSKVAAVMKGCAVLRHLADKAAATGHLDHAERLSVLYTLGHLGEPGQRAIHTIIRKCSNYDERETERHISRLSGLPIGCTRMRDKHVTPELEAHCRCPFDEVRKRGGYPTPLLHAIPFKRHWRDILRERDRPAEPPEGSEQGVRVLPASPLPAPAEIEHCTAAGLPPHEWAAPSRGRR